MRAGCCATRTRRLHAPLRRWLPRRKQMFTIDHDYLLTRTVIIVGEAVSVCLSEFWAIVIKLLNHSESMCNYGDLLRAPTKRGPRDPRNKLNRFAPKHYSSQKGINKHHPRLPFSVSRFLGYNSNCPVEASKIQFCWGFKPSARSQTTFKHQQSKIPRDGFTHKNGPVTGLTDNPLGYLVFSTGAHKMPPFVGPRTMLGASACHSVFASLCS